MIHAKLKQITKANHNALEARLSMLLSAEITLQQYAAIEKRFYGFYQPVEDCLLSIPELYAPRLNLSRRLKVPLLRADLASLAVGSVELAKLPTCDGPRPATVAAALGCLYVLEGSTLGARIIAGHLKNTLPIDEKRGCSFFNSYGDDVGPMWSSFLAALRSYCNLHGNVEVVLAAASETFASLDRWFAYDAGFES